MSDNEDFLINTRARRSNAGNRLKYLLELEELQREELSQPFATEDDENVNLLFQEDGEDVEYSEELSSDEDQDGDEDDNDEDGDVDDTAAHFKSSRKRAREEDSDDDEATNINEDDVFTDSDEESQESDAEEGEKELQLRERQKRRSKLKKAKQNVIPKIKLPAPKIQEPRKKTHIVDASSLLDDSRRSSSRKAVVENKLATVEKLKQLEERRKLNKPKERIEKYEMTQEERLLEAVETEKQNILSLNRFKEQELSKKERQRILQQSRRKKLVNVIRFKSFAHYITPAEELVEEEKLRDWLESRKEKRGRKKRVIEEGSVVEKLVNKELLEKAAAENPSSKETVIDPDDGSSTHISNLPSQFHSAEDNNCIKVEAPTNDLAQAEDSPVDEPTELSIDLPTELTGTNAESSLSGVKSENNYKEIDVLLKDEKDLTPQGTNPSDDEPTNATENTPSSSNLDSGAVVGEHIEVEANATVETEQSVSIVTELKTEIKDVSVDELDVITTEDSLHNLETGSVDASLDVKAGMESSVKDELEIEDNVIPPATLDAKKVTFAVEEEVVLVDDQNTETSNDVESNQENGFKDDKDISSLEVVLLEEKVVHEGPVQLVSRNLVSFESFDHPVSNATIKEILLGSQSLYQAQRRSNEVEPLVRIKANSADEDLEKNLFKSFKDLRKQQFREFLNLPKFGNDLSALHSSNEEEDVETVQEIKITTPAPVGIYLPNGMKKKCLITGKESQYFDPKNGLPYSSVEAYKVLQQVQNGEFSWCQFSSTGGVYLNDRNLKPAKGCPERF